MKSPYKDIPVEQWSAVTEELIKDHPLDEEMILEAALDSWRQLQATTVGGSADGFKLSELSPPAPVIGYLFERLFAKELAKRLPESWIGGVGSQKDLHCITDETKSVEMKSSGQMGNKVFGNRSYGQEIENVDAAKKNKSGYYITANFFGPSLNRIRFGWIDSTDWRAQKSQTGQMAGLGDEVYEHKLKTIKGNYMLAGSVQLLPGVGPSAAKALAERGISTISDLLSTPEENLPKSLQKHLTVAKSEYGDIAT